MRLMQLACVILALLHFKIKDESKILFRTMNIIETWSICLFGEGIRSKVAISFIFGVMNELDKSNEKYCTRYSRRVTELVLFQKDSYFNIARRNWHILCLFCDRVSKDVCPLTKHSEEVVRYAPKSEFYLRISLTKSSWIADLVTYHHSCQTYL